jgi:hypothetical protein
MNKDIMASTPEQLGTIQTSNVETPLPDFDWVHEQRNIRGIGTGDTATNVLYAICSIIEIMPRKEKIQTRSDHSSQHVGKSVSWWFEENETES